MACRYLRTLHNSPALQYPPAQLTVSLACVLYLISSFDLVDARIPDEETRSQVIRRFHDLQLFANDHWLDHLSALTNSPTDSMPNRSLMLSLSQALERLTERHSEVINTEAWKTQADDDSFQFALEEDWYQLGVSTATENLLNKLLAYRSKSAEGDGIANCSCKHRTKLSLITFLLY